MLVWVSLLPWGRAKTFSQIWVSNPRQPTAFLSSRGTICYQSFEVALSWSGIPSIFSHLGYFCSHIISSVSLLLDSALNEKKTANLWSGKRK